ncbi:MAG TPA: glycosyltransferase [Pirellulales bacterium]|jgi:glycosyltransferase involved in cell wall biosynthesis|nr:glycosyltransferase [Pirellulales bacterium]
MSTTTIIVPCHNEARRFNSAQFGRFSIDHQDVRFLLVNDGSQDATLTIIEGLAVANPRQFEVLNLVQNRGKAEAVRLGILQAARRNTDYIGFWDADLATPLQAIVDFISVLERRPEIELLLGVRMPLLGHNICRQPLRRRLGTVFAQVASFTLGVRFRDTQCGAKMFRASPEIMAAFSQPFHSRWIFDVELLARMIRMQRRTTSARLQETVYELPLDQWEDVAGSKLKRGDFFKAVSELAAIWWRYLRPAAPQFTQQTVKETTPEEISGTIRRAA